MCYREPSPAEFFKLLYLPELFSILELHKIKVANLAPLILDEVKEWSGVASGLVWVPTELQLQTIFLDEAVKEVDIGLGELRQPVVVEVEEGQPGEAGIQGERWRGTGD